MVPALLLLAAVVAFLSVTMASAVDAKAATATEMHPSGYVGRARCVGCHAGEAAHWSASHHAHAMEPAGSGTGPNLFTGPGLVSEGSLFTPHVHAGIPAMRVRDPVGTVTDYPIAFAFGVYPLRQYLTAFPDGRYQVLPVAWDARPPDEGGQRWFALYPATPLPVWDTLHWTGRNQTWNGMCADCHSTGLRKGYDAATRTWHTTWSDLTVACEACHGPGAAHVAWAEGGASATVADKGLAVRLAPDAGTGGWGDFDARGIRRWQGPPRDTRETDLCAPCHARRRPLLADWRPGRPLLDTHSPALLDDELYYPDGQIKDEVFEYDSFLQSRMQRAGVVCTDCHDAHALTLKGDGNAVCAQCHDSGRFDTPAHHHHTAGTAAARCVTCHMPNRTYMGVHIRHDHGFRLPAPARSAALGTPDPCLSCHGDRGAAWSEAALDRWGGGRHRVGSAFARALADGRTGAPDALAELTAAASDSDNPAIARASALALLVRFPGPSARAALARGATDPDPLVRLGAVRGLASDRDDTQALLLPLVRDPARAVRIEAARQLAPLLTAKPDWPDADRAATKSALAEWMAAERAAADRPESALNLGVLWAETGDAIQAESALRDALAQDPRFTAARLDLADLYRALGRDGEGAAQLRQAVALAPDDADAHYALGLALVRQGSRDEALAELGRAAGLAPDDARIAYAYGLGLRENGDTGRALAVLEDANRRHPGDRDVIVALLALARATGDAARVRTYSRALAAFGPGAAP